MAWLNVTGSGKTSCGTAVPLFDYVADREELNAWAARKDTQELEDYWSERNRESLDGPETGISRIRAEKG